MGKKNRHLNDLLASGDFEKLGEVKGAGSESTEKLDTTKLVENKAKEVAVITKEIPAPEKKSETISETISKREEDVLSKKSENITTEASVRNEVKKVFHESEYEHFLAMLNEPIPTKLVNVPLDERTDERIGVVMEVCNVKSKKQVVAKVFELFWEAFGEDLKAKHEKLYRERRRNL